MLEFDSEVEEIQDIILDEEALVLFREEMNNNAEAALLNFFEDKEWYCGGKIPKSELINCRTISTVCNTDIVSAVTMVYPLLDGDECTDDKIPSDVQLVIELIMECARKKIPRCFVGGIIVVYLELCEGVLSE